MPSTKVTNSVSISGVFNILYNYKVNSTRKWSTYQIYKPNTCTSNALTTHIIPDYDFKRNITETLQYKITIQCLLINKIACFCCVLVSLQVNMLYIFLALQSFSRSRRNNGWMSTMFLTWQMVSQYEASSVVRVGSKYEFSHTNAFKYRDFTKGPNTIQILYLRFISNTNMLLSNTNQIHICIIMQPIYLCDIAQCGNMYYIFHW